MSDNDKESFECLLDQFSPKRLHPNNRLFTGSESVSDGSYGKPAVQNASPKPEEPIELVSDICEFAVGKCFGTLRIGSVLIKLFVLQKLSKTLMFS